jgi:hypothetical protein
MSLNTLHGCGRCNDFQRRLKWLLEAAEAALAVAYNDPFDSDASKARAALRIAIAKAGVAAETEAV